MGELDMDLSGWLEYFTEGLATQEYAALCPGANRRTLQRDLRFMVGRGLLAELGAGPTDPTRHYRPAEAILGAEEEL